MKLSFGVPNCILIHGARQLLALRGSPQPRRGADLGQLHIIEDGSVLIQGGTIVEVGPSRRIENLALARHATVIGADGCVVVPAFVDCDTESLLLGTPASNWPTDRSAPDDVEAPRDIPGPRLKSEAERVLAGMLRHGTLTAETKASQLRQLRALQNVDSSVEVVPTLALSSDITDDMLASIRRRGLAASASIDVSAIPEMLERARVHRYRLHMAAENCDSPKRKLADSAGVLSTVRIEHPSGEEIETLASSNAIAVLKPSVTFHRGGTHYAPGRNMIDRGVLVALSTGYGPAANPSYSMPMAISLACRKMRLTPAEALTAATINAAHALGIGDRIGSLEPGKQADLLVLGVPDYRALAWEFGVNTVQIVIKRGNIVYDAGRAK